MENNSSDPTETVNSEDSLENPAGAPEPTPPSPDESIPPSLESDADDEALEPAPPPPAKHWRTVITHFNIYLLLFILVMIIAVAVVVIAYLDSQHNSTTANLTSKSLSPTTLAQLANSNATVGGSDQVLNVESSTVFAGQILARQNLDVAGNLHVGGTLALNNLSVAGTSQLGQAQINQNLAVAGNTSLQGSATIAKSLQVSGSGTFSGPLSAPQVTTPSLQLNGDLLLTHHITAGGATPGRTSGSALGSGGTSSVSGSDTAGSITINTGGSPAVGCFVTINFNARYNATPHVLVTPVGVSAGGLSYYINRSASSFSVCDAAAAPAGSSFGFDYFVVD